mmetsp:Transcript_28805/g.41267  ORF Transcript_28805/g.41267 Transcript_28805/m.41267 type:complete len:187 (-) Transcript_28805:1190-1750(-)
MHQHEGKANGTLAAIGSMYITFIPKLLDHLDHLACLPAKSQLRKDLLPPAVFVMQAAPSGLLSALWRKLIRRTVGKASSTSSKQDAGGGVSRTRSNSIDSHLFPPPIDASSLSGSSWDKTEVTMEDDDKPCIIYVVCLLWNTKVPKLKRSQAINSQHGRKSLFTTRRIPAPLLVGSGTLMMGPPSL